MNARRSAASRAGLAVSPRVTVPHERYRLVIQAFIPGGHAWKLRGPVHKARIAEILDKLIETAGVDDVGLAIRYAHEHFDGFTRWCLRYPERVLSIIAEADTP